MVAAVFFILFNLFLNKQDFNFSLNFKGFKRNEHLARHSIIHSGDKSQVCPECGKAFYRKDHLRKHLRSHVAKRVKTEHSPPPTSQQQTVAQLAAMVSMNANLQNANLEGATLSLLTSPV